MVLGSLCQLAGDSLTLALVQGSLSLYVRAPVILDSDVRASSNLTLTVLFLRPYTQVQSHSEGYWRRGFKCKIVNALSEGNCWVTKPWLSQSHKQSCFSVERSSGRWEATEEALSPSHPPGWSSRPVMNSVLVPSVAPAHSPQSTAQIGHFHAALPSWKGPDG